MLDQRGGAVGARQAHNLEDGGSKPLSAIVFSVVYFFCFLAILSFFDQIFYFFFFFNIYITTLFKNNIFNFTFYLTPKNILFFIIKLIIENFFIIFKYFSALDERSGTKKIWKESGPFDGLFFFRIFLYMFYFGYFFDIIFTKFFLKLNNGKSF